MVYMLPSLQTPILPITGNTGIPDFNSLLMIFYSHPMEIYLMHIKPHSLYIRKIERSLYRGRSMVMSSQR